MRTEGIPAIFLTTHNWGKSAKFFQALVSRSSSKPIIIPASCAAEMARRRSSPRCRRPSGRTCRWYSRSPTRHRSCRDPASRWLRRSRTRTGARARRPCAIRTGASGACRHQANRRRERDDGRVARHRAGHHRGAHRAVARAARGGRSPAARAGRQRGPCTAGAGRRLARAWRHGPGFHAAVPRLDRGARTLHRRPRRRGRRRGRGPVRAARRRARQLRAAPAGPCIAAGRVRGRPAAHAGVEAAAPARTRPRRATAAALRAGRSRGGRHLACRARCRRLRRAQAGGRGVHRREHARRTRACCATWPHWRRTRGWR